VLRDKILPEGGMFRGALFQSLKDLWLILVEFFGAFAQKIAHLSGGDPVRGRVVIGKKKVVSPFLPCEGGDGTFPIERI